MKPTCLALALVFAAACGSSSKPAAPSNTAAPTGAVTADCAAYEHQADLCRATCEECSVSTPGNSCNVCAEACASKIWCEQCGATEMCDAGAPE
jgi:hypothetical protein